MRYLTILLVLLAVPALAQDQDETLTCSAESSPDEFTEVGGTGCAIVEDANDGTYYTSTTDYSRQRWAIDNSSYTYSVIDSVVLHWRHGGVHASKSQPEAFDIFVGTDSTMGGEVDYANNTIRDTTICYTVAPDAGAWTVDDVNGLETQIRCGNIASGGGVNCYEFSVVVWGTREAGEETPTRRRRILTGE